jgi:hypothetical protein
MLSHVVKHKLQFFLGEQRTDDSLSGLVQWQCDRLVYSFIVNLLIMPSAVKDVITNYILSKERG